MASNGRDGSTSSCGALAREGSARRGLAAGAALALAGLAAACSAPEAEPLRGPAAEDVREALESGTGSFSHDEWDELLSGAVEDGLVDYVHVQRRRDLLDAYLGRVARADLATLAPDHLEALLVNAYNAYTVEAIVEHPEVSSIREIDGVWSETPRTVGGHELTLDQIEHNLLRPYFRDPRVHFVVNCASLSCAPLPPRAFDGDSLDAQFERRTRAFLRDPDNVRVEEGRLLLSRYFDWYGGDFTGDGWSPRAESIPRFVARYAGPDVADFVERHDGAPPVGFLDYDWSLNASVPPDPALSGADDGGGGAEARGAGGEGGASSETGAAAGREPASGDDEADAAAGGEAPQPAEAAREGWVAELRGWIADLGPAGPLVYGLAYVVATVLFLPGAPLTVGAGMAFGLLWGTVLVSAASVVGAALAFLVARHLLRGRVESSLREGGKIPFLGEERSRRTWRFLEVVDRAVESGGWKIVGLARLSPAFPFNVQNYAWGLTGVRFLDYVLASWVAMLPGTLLYVYIGVAAAGVAQSATGAADWGRTALQVLGLLATLAVVVAAGRVATRALREAAEMDGAGDGGGGAGDDGPGGDPGSPADAAAAGR